MDWSKLIESAPNVAALLAVVGMFLWYLNKRDTVLKDVSDACHENQRASIVAIENTAKAITEMRITLAKINGR